MRERVLIQRFGLAAASMLMMVGAVSQTGASRYVEGQVWEYRTRPQDSGSLLKIQKIEPFGTSGFGSVYHVSIIGLHFHGLPLDGILQHAPFSQAALDQSVTKLSSSAGPFPDASGGIAEWKRAHGGVFTISVADAVAFVEEAMTRQVPVEKSAS